MSPLSPPHMTISEPVQTAVWPLLTDGQIVPGEVGTQLSVEGVYRPPVFRLEPLPMLPPQMIISLPVHIACEHLLEGQLGPVEVGSQLSVDRLYRPPVFS